MKISINWLDEWVEIADVDPRDLAHRLTMAGLEVEGIEYRGRGHDDIVVGEIVAVDEHPDADRLVLCEVDVGDEDSPQPIVCGATNMEAGDRVPVALPGSEPPGVDFAISSREVMGVMSHGMLCSSEELELTGDSDGLMIIDDDVGLGQPVFDALELKDAILDIDLTPNRADCLSHRGVAREVAALYERPLRDRRLEGAAIGDSNPVSAGEVADLKVVDEKGCPHYRMAILEDVDVRPSPVWLQRRLQSIGIRPVNGVVDVTNYVLMDIGQPLHAFDLDRLAGSRIAVRRARPGETMVAIDHEEYELDPDDLVICDDEGPVALAGVMGGERTEVTEETSRVLLECAYFEPASVRRTSKRHGLHTDSSHRFERSIDAGAVATALRVAVELLEQTQRDVVGRKPTVFRGAEVAGGGPERRQTIELNPDRASELLGANLEFDWCVEALESIGIEVDSTSETVLRCTVPTYRNDLERPVDLVEELARLYGYDNIESSLPRLVVGKRHQRGDGDRLETIVGRDERRAMNWIRTALLDQGLSEAVSYSFMGEADFDRLRLSADDCRRMAPRVANPLVASQARMRTTLMASMLDNLKTNFSHSRRDVALFEIGRRYFSTGEQRTLAIAVSGRRRRHFSSDRQWDFFDLKGIVESVATPFAIDGDFWRRPETQEPYLHPGVQAQWMVGDQLVGFAGQLHPELAEHEDIEETVLVAEIDLECLVEAGRRQTTARPAAKYPSVIRDFALVCEESTPYAEVRRAVETLAERDGAFGAYFEAMELFDVYRGEQLSEGQRSLAIKITYRSNERTLEEPDVEAADRQLLSHLEESVGARLR